ncbi:MAG: hypothetical protein Q8881_04295, partial [Sweet potato little leaf phytoplasma]|nr:hypothetical protein [Sweet potato little leaf phytoplasma]
MSHSGTFPPNGRKKKFSSFEEKIVKISKIVKVVKGGRRFRFSALVVVGD